MASQQDPNGAMLLINKLLGPNSTPGPPPPHPPILNPPPGPFIPFAPGGHLPPPPPFMQYFPQNSGPPPPVGILPAPVPTVPKKSATPEKKDMEALKSKYADSHKKSRKRRYDDSSRRVTKNTSYDELMASHGTSANNRKPRGSLNTESQKVMGKQIRAILAHEHKEVVLKPGSDKKKKKNKKTRGEKDYNDLSEFLPNESVARKRRKIQDRVRSKRDSAKEDKVEDSGSVYDYMHYDPDTELLKKRRERVLSSFQKKDEEGMPSIDETLKEIEEETLNENQEPGEIVDDNAHDNEVEEVFAKTPPLPTSQTKHQNSNNSAPAIEPGLRIGIRGSLSHPPSPKPSEMEIKRVLEDMEEGELSDDEEEYNKLINDVEAAGVAPQPTPGSTAAIGTPEKRKQPLEVDMISPAKTPSKDTPEKVTKGNLNTGVPPVVPGNTTTIPLLAAATPNTTKKEGSSILDDLAFLNSIKTKYNSPSSVRKPIENVETRSKELIEQLLRQDKISREREKQKRSKEKQREKDKKEREKMREEKKREKLERIRELEAQIATGGPVKVKGSSKAATATSRRLKSEFKSNFIKASEVTFEGTLAKSTIDHTVLDEGMSKTVEEFVETKEHRFENGLVIQTSVQKVDDEELLNRNKPVRYDFSKVNVEYPDFAVAGAIAYRLREKKQRLIHRVVGRIGKERALELLFKTEEIEKNGGELTKNGDRRKQPGGVFLGLLKQHCTTDDIKYIFAAEVEIESEANVFRKRQARNAKRKRYAKNKTEKNLSNALTNALSLGGKDEENNEEVPEEDKFVGYIPPCDAINSLSATHHSKPKPFPLSVVKSKSSVVLVTVGEEGKPAAASKVEEMKKGYSSFVKKGAATPADVFKPSHTAHMTKQSNIFDELLKTTKDLKQRADDPVDMEEEPAEDDNDVLPHPVTMDAPVVTMVTGEGARAASGGEVLKGYHQPLKPLPPNRAAAIAEAAKPKDVSEMSEGECSDSEEEMET